MNLNEPHLRLFTRGQQLNDIVSPNAP